TDKAAEATASKLADLAHIVPEPAPKKHTGAKVFAVIAGCAAAVAAVAVWRRSRPQVDPWAEDPWDEEPRAWTTTARSEFSGAVTGIKSDIGDAAEHVGEFAGEAVAKGRGVRDAAEDAVEEVTDKAKHAAHEVADKAKDT